MDFSFSTLLVTFLSGVFMFLAPCTFPLVPAFIASLVPESSSQSIHTRRKELSIRTVAFTFGFTLVFIIFGLLSGYVGGALVHYKTLLSQIGGFVIIIFGLSLMHVFEIPFLKGSKGVFLFVKQNANSRHMSLFMGIVFALGWTPCAGPILASILLLASQSSTVVQGGILLFIFSLGLSIPFLLMGFLYAHTLQLLSLYGRYVRGISFISGFILVMLGSILFFEQSFRMTELGFGLYSYFGYAPMCSYF